MRQVFFSLMKKLLFILSIGVLFSCQEKQESESAKELAPTKAEQEVSTTPNLYDLGVYVVDIERSRDFYTSVFGLKVVREWTSIDLSYDDENYMTAPLHGLYLEGDNGMHLELIQKGDPEKRQDVQQPINHFAIHVKDVRKVYEKAIALGAKCAFEDERLQYARMGTFKVLNTQIIGLDGERIQILEILEN